MGLTANQVKSIRLLKRKKERQEQGLFLAEGEKLVLEALNAQAKIEGLYALPDILPKGVSYELITPKQLSQVSNLTTPAGCIALVKIPEEVPFSFSAKLTLALDRISDPGNLGTILRIADWFGISEVFCSDDSVDYTNPKVVQSSMGAVFRVRVNYGSLTTFIKSFKETTQGDVITAEMNGLNVHEYQPRDKTLLVMGSESHGVAPEVSALADGQIHIPGKGKAESLNVAVSTGIICSTLLK